MLGGLERELRRITPAAPRRQRAQATSAQDWALPSVLNRMLEGLLALTGLTAESLVRDAGWLFMDAGRRLERAIHVVALLRATVVQERAAEVDALVVETVLGATESIVTFRRRNPARAGVGSLLDLVLTDRENPRSVAYQLDRLQEDFTALGDVLDGSGAESVRDGLLAAGRPGAPGRRGCARGRRVTRTSGASSTTCWPIWPSGSASSPCRWRARTSRSPRPRSPTPCPGR